DLGQLLPRDSHGSKRGIEQHRARGRGSLINREEVVRHLRCLLSDSRLVATLTPSLPLLGGGRSEQHAHRLVGNAARVAGSFLPLKGGGIRWGSTSALDDSSTSRGTRARHSAAELARRRSMNRASDSCSPGRRWSPSFERRHNTSSQVSTHSCCI